MHTGHEGLATLLQLCFKMLDSTTGWANLKVYCAKMLRAFDRVLIFR